MESASAVEMRLAGKASRGKRPVRAAGNTCVRGSERQCSGRDEAAPARGRDREDEIRLAQSDLAQQASLRLDVRLCGRACATRECRTPAALLGLARENAQTDELA